MHSTSPSVARRAAGLPIRVGLVGAGNWATYAHLPVLSLLPQYEVVAVQARRRDAAEGAAAKFSIANVMQTMDQLVSHQEVDLVLVLNTAPQHADVIRAAIAAGKDVFCEWPLTVSTEVASELAALASEAGVKHMVGLQRRLAPHNRYVRELLARGYVGSVRSVRLHVSIRYLQATRPENLRWTAPRENFSHVVSIYAGHYLDKVFELVGRPTSLSALQLSQFPLVRLEGTNEVLASDAPDQLLMFGRLLGGAVLSIHVEGGKRNGSGVQIDITGDEGDLRITNTAAFGLEGDDWHVEGARGDDLPLLSLAVPPEYRQIEAAGLPSAVLEMADLYVAFARDAESGTSNAPSFIDAVWLHRLFDSIDASSRSGTTVLSPSCDEVPSR